MEGRRVVPNSEGWLPNLKPGDYGRCTSTRIKDNSVLKWWQVCAPDGSQGALSPLIHTVIEHQNGTITVSPSLDFSKHRPGAYHGYLVAGKWNP